MSNEAIATIVTAAFLGWAWLVARRFHKESDRRAAERRARPERETALRNPLNGPTPYERELSRRVAAMNETSQHPRY